MHYELSIKYQASSIINYALCIMNYALIQRQNAKLRWANTFVPAIG